MLKTVKTENGYVRGIPAADPRVISFKGIPFAAPPVGDLRWRAPQPARDWEGVRDCLEFAPISMQSIPGLNEENIYTREWNVDPTIPMNEDCLYLNVWTPAVSETDKLPVYVWYFGGGLQWGNPAEMEFDGERLARRGIVVVTVNYRLNAVGGIAPGARQFRKSGSAVRPVLDEAEYCGVRRGSGEYYHRRTVGGRRKRPDPAELPEK